MRTLFYVCFAAAVLASSNAILSSNAIPLLDRDVVAVRAWASPACDASEPWELFAVMEIQSNAVTGEAPTCVVNGTASFGGIRVGSAVSTVNSVGAKMGHVRTLVQCDPADAQAYATSLEVDYGNGPVPVSASVRRDITDCKLEL